MSFAEKLNELRGISLEVDETRGDEIPLDKREMLKPHPCVEREDRIWNLKSALICVRQDTLRYKEILRYYTVRSRDGAAIEAKTSAQRPELEQTVTWLNQLRDAKVKTFQHAFYSEGDSKLEIRVMVAYLKAQLNQKQELMETYKASLAQLRSGPEIKPDVVKNHEIGILPDSDGLRVVIGMSPKWEKIPTRADRKTCRRPNKRPYRPRIEQDEPPLPPPKRIVLPPLPGNQVLSRKRTQGKRPGFGINDPYAPDFLEVVLEPEDDQAEKNHNVPEVGQKKRSLAVKLGLTPPFERECSLSQDEVENTTSQRSKVVSTAVRENDLGLKARTRPLPQELSIPIYGERENIPDRKMYRLSNYDGKDHIIPFFEWWQELARIVTSLRLTEKMTRLFIERHTARGPAVKLNELLAIGATVREILTVFYYAYGKTDEEERMSS